MSTTYSQSGFIGDEGVDFVGLTCTRARTFFLVRPRQDVGIDGHIEFLSPNYEPTGAVAHVQVKSGLSYVTSSGKYVIKADAEHFQTWSRYKYPVIGIVYNPACRDARWVNISQFIRDHDQCIAKGPYVIEAPPSQPFSESSFSVLQNEVEKWHQELGEHSLSDLIEQYLNGDPIAKADCLTPLFSRFRWTAVVCFFIHQALRIESDPDTIAYLTYLLSFYRPDPDRWCTEDNSMPISLRPLAKVCIAGFDVPEIIKMLSILKEDKNGFERGSMGALVMVQLSDIPDVYRKLCVIAADPNCDSEVRVYAIGVLGEWGYDDPGFYERLLESERNPDIRRMLTWALETVVSP